MYKNNYCYCLQEPLIVAKVKLPYIYPSRGHQWVLMYLLENKGSISENRGSLSINRWSLMENRGPEKREMLL